MITQHKKFSDSPIVVNHNTTIENIVQFSKFGSDNFWENNSMWKNEMYTYNILQINKIKCALIGFNEHRGGWESVKQDISNKHIGSIYNKYLFYDMLDLNFLFNKGEVLLKPWCGILHCTPITPHYLNFININNIFDNPNFVQSLKQCKCIITLSTYLTNYFKNKFDELKLNIIIYTLKHPTETKNIIPFSYIDFIHNKNKKLIQIGQQLRKVSSIYLLPDIPDYTKLWLTGTKNFDKLNKFLDYETTTIKKNIEMCYLNDYTDYDKLLANNIVYIELYDAAANNTVVECIVRNTPIIVNKIPGVVDYLGEDYPLYYNNLDEVPNLITNENIFNAYQYLLNMNKEEFEIEYFTNKLITLLYNVMINDQ
jgi:hypothetical protein